MYTRRRARLRLFGLKTTDDPTARLNIRLEEEGCSHLRRRREAITFYDPSSGMARRLRRLETCSLWGDAVVITLGCIGGESVLAQTCSWPRDPCADLRSTDGSTCTLAALILKRTHRLVSHSDDSQGVQLGYIHHEEL
jgi:hypothetical protein